MHASGRTMEAEAARLTKQHAAEAACTNGVFSLKHSKNLKLLSSATNHAASAFVVHARARTMTPVAACWLQAARTNALSHRSAVCRSRTHYSEDPSPTDKKKALTIWVWLEPATGGSASLDLWTGKKQSSWHFPSAGPQHTISGKTRPLAAAIPHREPNNLKLIWHLSAFRAANPPKTMSAANPLTGRPIRTKVFSFAPFSGARFRRTNRCRRLKPGDVDNSLLHCACHYYLPKMRSMMAVQIDRMLVIRTNPKYNCMSRGRKGSASRSQRRPSTPIDGSPNWTIKSVTVFLGRSP